MIDELKMVKAELRRRTHERNYAQRECEAVAETAKKALTLVNFLEWVLRQAERPSGATIQ